jgi:hypothetical protein
MKLHRDAQRAGRGSSKLTPDRPRRRLPRAAMLCSLLGSSCVLAGGAAAQSMSVPNDLPARLVPVAPVATPEPAWRIVPTIAATS